MSIDFRNVAIKKTGFPSNPDYGVKRMNFQKISSVALIVMCLAGMVLMFARIGSVRSLSHDGAISILAATGNLKAYSEEGPRNALVRASEWQKYWKIHSPGCFRRISRDLANKDIHPPLYFWALHVWFLGLGLSIQKALWLNVVCQLLAAVVIARCCVRLSCPLWLSVWSASMWFFNNANMSVGMEVRQYSMLSLFSIVFMLNLLNFLKLPEKRNAGWLGLALLAGMLVHYHFWLLALIAIGLVSLQISLRREWKTLKYLFGASVGSCILFYSLHPGFLLSFQRQSAQSQSFSWVSAAERLTLARYTFWRQFLDSSPFEFVFSRLDRFWPYSGLFMLILALMIIVRFFKSPFSKGIRACVFSDKTIPFVSALVCVAVIIALYVSCQSPSHAMGPKYLMLTSPLIAVGIGQLLNYISISGNRTVLVFALVLLVSQVMASLEDTVKFVYANQDVELAGIDKPSATVLLDSTARGILPVILWHADPDASVFAGSQETIIQLEKWDFPFDKKLTYISNLSYGNTLQGADFILQHLMNNELVFQKRYTGLPWRAFTFEFIPKEINIIEYPE